MLKSDTSSRDFSGNRHTHDCLRQLRTELESLARGCHISPDASFLPRQRCARVRASSPGAVSCALTAAVIHQPNHLDRLPRRGSRTPSALQPRRRRSTSTVTFKTGRRRTESYPFTKRANMCADHARTLDACGVATPYRRRRKLVQTAIELARAQAMYRSLFRGAYAPRRSRAMPPCRPSTAKSSVSRTDPYDAPDPLAVRGLERVELRVVPVSPTPPMAAGQSEPRGLGHAWRLVTRGVARL